MNKIRTLVRFIVESAVTGEQATSNELALVRQKEGHVIVYVLYDPRAVNQFIESSDYPKMNLSPHLDNMVYGFLAVQPHEGGCWDASEIKNAAAKQGYGPLVYDLAMSDSNGIMPDRISVSKDAQNIWQFYAKKRSDVSRKKFDDFNEPKTEESNDDCTLVDDPTDTLNYAYDGGTNVSSYKAKLLLTHDRFSEETKISKKQVENLLLTLGREFFRKKYD